MGSLNTLVNSVGPDFDVYRADALQLISTALAYDIESVVLVGQVVHPLYLLHSDAALRQLAIFKRCFVYEPRDPAIRAEHEIPGVPSGHETKLRAFLVDHPLQNDASEVELVPVKLHLGWFVDRAQARWFVWSDSLGTWALRGPVSP